MTDTKLNLPELKIPSEDSAAEVSQFQADAELIVKSIKNFDARSPSDIVSLIYPLMKEAIRFKNVSGATKKAIVIAALKLVIKEANIPDSLKADISSSIDLLAPPIIDQIYNFNLDEFKAEIKNCFSCCPCCK